MKKCSKIGQVEPRAGHCRLQSTSHDDVVSSASVSWQGAQSRTWLAGVLTLLVYAAAHAQPSPQINADELTDEHVRAAIDAIAAMIAARMDDETLWEPHSPPSGESAQPGGYTALAVLALLSAGESYQGERLAEAVKKLEDVEMTAVYGLAMRASLWAHLPERFRSNLEDDAQQLTRGFQRNGGGWYYHINGPPIYISNSRRMFGALGLWEAANRGVRVPRSVWHQLEQAFLSMQLADGGWNYRGDGPATGSMTASGLATLFFTQDHLHSDRFVQINPRRRRTEPVDVAIERGLNWLDRNFAVSVNPGSTARSVRSRYFYYYVYSLERAALASGYKRFGGQDWFRAGAAELIHRTCEWDVGSRAMTAHEKTYGDGRRAALRTDDLAFALMFLSRGRVPIAVNKLRDPSVAWNNRPRDVANFTAWLSDEAATTLNWQIVDIDADPATWLDAPLLYFASHQAVPWAREEAAELRRIKRYLDLGGMLVAVGEGGGRQFAESIEVAGRLMYPHLEWRTIESDHWAFNAHASVDRGRPRLRALGNGVRDLIILATDDLSATFQRRRGQPIAHYETLANFYFVASEMNRPKPRLAAQSPVAFLEDGEPVGHVSATIVRAQPGSGSPPEPLAIEVFADALARAGDIQVTLADHRLDAIEVFEPKPDVIIVSGVSDATFSEAERDAIAAFVKSGGVVLFEQTGGSPTGRFMTAAESLAQEILDDAPRSMRDHAIITGQGIDHATDLSRIEYRPYSLIVTGSIETVPRLRGMAHESGGMILLSREDISHALLDQPCWGIHGYSPRSARLLLRNVLLYSAMRR